MTKFKMCPSFFKFYFRVFRFQEGREGKGGDKKIAKRMEQRQSTYRKVLRLEMLRFKKKKVTKKLKTVNIYSGTVRTLWFGGQLKSSATTNSSNFVGLAVFLGCEILHGAWPTFLLLPLSQRFFIFKCVFTYSFPADFLINTSRDFCCNFFGISFSTLIFFFVLFYFF